MRIFNVGFNAVVTRFGRFDEDGDAIRRHHNQKAAEQLGESLRRLDRGWDAPPMSDDDRAYHDDAVRRAVEEFRDSYTPSDPYANESR